MSKIHGLNIMSLQNKSNEGGFAYNIVINIYKQIEFAMT